MAARAQEPAPFTDERHRIDQVFDDFGTHDHVGHLVRQIHMRNEIGPPEFHGKRRVGEPPLCHLEAWSVAIHADEVPVV